MEESNEQKIYVINGNHFSNLEEFFQEIQSVLTPETHQCKSIDCFNDVIKGGLGTPDEGYILIWKNADLSRRSLGYEATARLRQEGLQSLRQNLTDEEILRRELARIKRSFPDQNDEYHQSELKDFQAAYREMQHNLDLNLQNQGQTIFDILIEIILRYPKIELSLE